MLSRNRKAALSNQGCVDLSENDRSLLDEFAVTQFLRSDVLDGIETQMHCEAMAGAGSEREQLAQSEKRALDNARVRVVGSIEEKLMPDMESRGLFYGLSRRVSGQFLSGTTPVVKQPYGGVRRDAIPNLVLAIASNAVIRWSGERQGAQARRFPVSASFVDRFNHDVFHSSSFCVSGQRGVVVRAAMRAGLELGED